MIKYRDSAEGIDESDLEGFFQDWPNPLTKKKHLELLNRSSYAIIALDGKKVVGFVNAISDGILTAYIPLLEVLLPCKGQGIGTELMSRMLEKLKDYYMVDVLCEKDVAPFYDKLGMQRGVGMFNRNYDALRR